MALVALLATRQSADDQGITSQVVGQAVPAVQGTTLDGAHYDVDNHLNQWVVIDFFGSWCAPCHAEQPELVKFAREHKDDSSISMLGIMYRDQAADGTQLLQDDRRRLADHRRQRHHRHQLRGLGRTRDLRRQPERPGGGQVRGGRHRLGARLGAPPVRGDDHDGRNVTDAAAPTGAPRRESRVRVWAPWLAMLVVLAVALVIGTFGSSGPETNADRVIAISRTLKCPVCSGESVAESNADASLDIRADIAKRLDQGQSADQIRAYYAARPTARASC